LLVQGTFTKKGLEVTTKDGNLVIVKEGSIKTFCKKVREVTFSGETGLTNGQEVLFITERAVFQVFFLFAPLQRRREM